MAYNVLIVNGSLLRDGHAQILYCSRYSLYELCIIFYMANAKFELFHCELV
jgi:hypothetical protein